MTMANGQTMLRSPINLYRKSNATFQNILNTGKYIRQNKTRTNLKKKNRVADPNPDPDPSNPYFLGLQDPDQDPLVRGMDPDPDHEAKIVRKTLIPTVLLLLSIRHNTIAFKSLSSSVVL